MVVNLSVIYYDGDDYDELPEQEEVTKQYKDAYDDLLDEHMILVKEIFRLNREQTSSCNTLLEDAYKVIGGLKEELDSVKGELAYLKEIDDDLYKKYTELFYNTTAPESPF